MSQPDTTASRPAGVLGVFFVSGATSLIYQVIWTRWLGLVFGNTTSSISVVLGAFMCGLALGSALAGRFMARVERPLRAYALCEAGIAVFAVVLPLLLRVIEALNAVVDDGNGGFAVVLGRTVLAFAAVCLPTGLMGATLPLLAEHFRRHPQAGQAWRVGVLYAANTIGAACGILLAGFVLIELLGVAATTGMAALGNLLVAAMAWRIARQFDATAAPQVAPASSSSKDLPWVAAALAVTGALALASEVLWTRVLSSFLGTSTYAFTTIVCTYLVGIAAGSWAMSRLIPRLRDVRGAFVVVVLMAGLVHMVSIEVFLRMATSWDLPRGVPTPISTILGFYLKFSMVLLPLAVASGACFPLATRILNDDDADAEGRLVARAYAANTWGSVVGSLTAGFVIAAWLDFEPSLRVVGIGYFIAAVVGAVAVRGSSSLSPVLTGVAVLAIAAFGGRLATRAPFAERFEQARPNRHVLRHDAGIQGVTTVTESRDPQNKAAIIYVNHHGMTVKLTDTKMMAHLPLFLHDKPDDALIICFGMGTTFRSALSHGGRATVVEIVPEVADSFEYFYADAAAIRANPKGRIVVGDGRHFLNATSQRYDVITLDPPPPIDGEGVNHLYSRDFALLAQAHLKPGGIVAHWIPAPGTGSGVDDGESIDMLLHTFSGVFRHTVVVVAFNNVGFHILGSDEPIDLSPERIAQRLANRPAAVADMNELQQVDPAFLSSGEPLGAPRSDLIVTDDHPVLEFNLLRNLIRGNPKVLTGHLWVP